MQKTWDWVHWPEMWWLFAALGVLVVLFAIHGLLRRREHAKLSDIEGFRARLDTSSPFGNGCGSSSSWSPSRS